jgi:hypothetical protein
MPPQNQNGPAPTGQYDFFMNPQQAGKPRLAGPSSPISRILVVVGGLVLLIIIFVIISSLLSGGPTPASLQTIVVEDQAEIMHLSKAGSNTASSAVAKNFAITSLFTITTDQQNLVTYLAQNKVKITPAQLALKVSAKTDADLATALSAGVYDQTYTQAMTTVFTSYAQDINTAYKKTTGTNGRKILASQYKSAIVLLKQLKNLPAQSQ